MISSFPISTIGNSFILITHGTIGQGRSQLLSAHIDSSFKVIGWTRMSLTAVKYSITVLGVHRLVHWHFFFIIIKQ